MNEWEFTAVVAGWINEILRRTPGLRFSEARCEQQRKGSRKRRDLTLLDLDRRPILTGEIKLPYQKDGNTPLNTSVVSDARAKARRARVSFFFTWNVNDFVLWPTESREGVWEDRSYRTWPVARVRSDEDLTRPAAEQSIRQWLAAFLPEFARIVTGEVEIGHKPPDEKFIDMLETSLGNPINFTLDELQKRYKTPRFKKDLDAWMTKEQDWVILSDEAGILDNLERASKFACYSLVNKLVFHEALLKRFGKRMGKLTVPKYISTGEDLRLRIESYFAKAKDVTGDYETVFGEDHTTIGNRIPFCSDHAVTYWRELISEIHQYDFTGLKYDIIGPIFERLLGPEERKKYGQFYTKPEIVDLINSFCIRNGTEKVMDPACGSGTFLVRAYARKKELNPTRTHNELLTDIYGVDIARFATEWTTINLATRDLVESANYPRVTRSDFFDVGPHSVALSLPKQVKTKGLGKSQHQDIVVPDLDALVGNLPYIRQEKIKNRKTEYQRLAKAEGRVALSGRSDIHCYFWPHAATFLTEDGYLGFLTSSQWLDVEYGFRLQEWMLRNFQIVAVFESIDEPWFVGARVATTVTILKRQRDEIARMNNVVRVVQLRKPVRELFANDGSMADAVRAVDSFRDEILALARNTVNERYRARLVRQADLWDEGVRLGEVMKKSDADEEDDEQSGGEYYGGKWGVYLRAPDLWFNLMDETGHRWERLGIIANVKRGITSGADDFFYVRDVTEDYLSSFPKPSEFRDATGYARKVFESGKVRLVQCGQGFTILKAIEAKYMQPEIHSLMEIFGYSVTAKDCSRKVLMVSKRKPQLKNTYVLEYIKWGEEQGFHKNKTCAARATEDREWYDLTGHATAPVLWPKERKYRHIAPANEERHPANCRLYEITPPPEGDDPLLWGGILNSSLTLLSSLQIARPVGTECTWSTMIVDVNVMYVPNPSISHEKSLSRVQRAFRQLKTRKALSFLSEKRLRRAALTQSGKIGELEKLSDISELEMADREELDDAVLEMLGVTSAKRRKEILNALYGCLHEFYETNRQIEEKANLNKILSKHKGIARPEDIAQQILEEMEQASPEFLRRYEEDFLDPAKDFDTYELPADGEPRYEPDMISSSAVTFVKGKGRRMMRVETRSPLQAELLAIVARSGVRSFIRIPHDDKECRKVLRAFEPFVLDRDQKVRTLINDRTADEDLQEKIYNALMPKLLNRRP